MPFCRECGKEIQDDWRICPYCESRIGPPSDQESSSQSTNMLLQDSVIAGDVTTTINDPDSISTAVQEATRCPHCDSSGVTIISCSGCDSMAYCSICQEEVFEERRDEFVSYSKGFIREEIEKIISKKRLCDDCYTNTRSNHKDIDFCFGCKKFGYYLSTCLSCKRSYCYFCNPHRSMLVGDELNHHIETGRKTPSLPEDFELHKTRHGIRQTESSRKKYVRPGLCFKVKLSDWNYRWGCREDEEKVINNRDES